MALKCHLTKITSLSHGTDMAVAETAFTAAILQWKIPTLLAGSRTSGQVHKVLNQSDGRSS